MMTTSHFQTSYKSSNGTFERHVTFMREFTSCPVSSISDEALDMFMTASSIIMGDTLVCYYTLRIDRLFDRINWADPINYMIDLNVKAAYDNLRLALRCIFLIRSIILKEYIKRKPSQESILMDTFDDCYKFVDDNDWYYRHYSRWCVHLVVNYGVPFEYLTLQVYSWHVMDLKYMCDCWRDLQDVMHGLGVTDAGVIHLLRPVMYPERMFPTLRYLIDLEHRTRINKRGEIGVTFQLRERSESSLEETVHEPEVRRVLIADNEQDAGV